MASHEREEVPDDYEISPEPPRRGTPAYREMVLRICAAEEYDEFHGRLCPPWEHAGWRLGLDVITETLSQLIRHYPTRYEERHPRDAFGNLPLPRFMRIFDETQRLQYAAQVSKTTYAHLPPHEGFKVAMKAGEEIWSFLEDLVPACQEAVNDMERTGQQDGAFAILLRYMNSTGDRLRATSQATSVTHATLRRYAMPPGDGWVKPFLLAEETDRADVSGSAAYYARMDPKMAANAMPEWWFEDDGEPAPPPRKVRRHPKCTCGFH